MSDRSQIDEIKDRLDIVTVVQEYVPSLKKSGRNFFGLCPFHQEKTPSFSVNSELGLFKCFGCGEGGDVIKFIEKIEGLDFPHALETAAKRAGIELKKFSDPKLKEQRQEKDKLIELNNLVAKYFNYLLLEHEQGKEAREYLKQRQIKTSSAKTFLLGFAPKGFENLKKFLIKKGYSESELIKWGLLATRNNRAYDKFRNRLMFPIFDHQGDVVGFSGRAIDPDEKGPKYLNSPETPVFNKSNLLYGLFQAKETLRKQDFAVLVEGNVDIITSHQAGVKNIVAPLGTALTLNQLRLLKRYCNTVYLAFDTDDAGQKAVLKSLELTEEIGLLTKAISIGKYKDVDELITSGENWKEVISKAVPVIDFLIKTQAKRFDLGDSRQKSTYSSMLLEFISKIQDDLERADYIEKLSKKAKTPTEELMKKLKSSMSENKDEKDVNGEKQTKQGTFNLDEETYVIALVAQHPQWQPEISDSEEVFNSAENSALFKAVMDKAPIKAGQKEFMNDIMLSEIEIFNSKQEFLDEFNKAINRLLARNIRKKIQELNFVEEDEKVVEELMHLTKKLKSLD